MGAASMSSSSNKPDGMTQLLFPSTLSSLPDLSALDKNQHKQPLLSFEITFAGLVLQTPIQGPATIIGSHFVVAEILR